MCCIFTFCGWMLDLVQRAWIFFMTCCISSAICCMLITASTMGIALGYNYSLAEYIDLKETNVSVYIKRGVFDDEIADDMNWRRSGHRPEISGLLSDKNSKEIIMLFNEVFMAVQVVGIVITGPPADETTTLKPGRRLDDSIYESSNQHQYEGSLLRLTANTPSRKSGELPFHPSPPYLIEASTEPYNTDLSSTENLYNLVSNFPEGSLDHLKAIQTVINARRSGGLNDKQVPLQPGNNPEQFIARRNQEAQTTNKYDDQNKYLEHHPGFPGSGEFARRNMMGDTDRAMPSNTFRDAVPRGDLTVYYRPVGESEYRKRPMPDPPTFAPSPIRPPVLTESRRKEKITVAPQSVPQVPTRVTQGRQTVQPKKDLNEDLAKYKQRLLINQYDAPNAKADDFKFKKPADVEDYDEEFKGAPVRKKRSIDNITEEQSSDTVLEPHRVRNQSFSNSNLSTRTLNDEINIINQNITINMDAVEHNRPSLKEKWKHSKEKKKKSRKSSRRRNNRPKRNKYKKRRQRRLTKEIIEISNGQKTPKVRPIYATKPPTSVAGHNATAIKPKNIGNTTDEGNRELENRTDSFVKIMNHYKSKANIKRENIAHPLEASNPKNLINFLFS